jgi:protocatechuate 3,4-dioxygenase beta subunit
MSREISRRQALASFGAVSLGALLAACGNDETEEPASTDVTTTGGATATVSPQTTSSSELRDLFDDAATCTLTPEETEGPYYFDVNSIRSDIREDREGATLRLAIRVRESAACTPLANAVVDVWHCDALGVYSGFESASTGGGGGAPGGDPTDQETYLRGAQVTNSDGIVEFVTVYPGWYRGRTVHIHAKVHLFNATVLTTQFYFDDDFTETVYTREPYSEDPGRDTFNDTDGIFDERLLLTMSEEGDGYLGLITLDVVAA